MDRGLRAGWGRGEAGHCQRSQFSAQSGPGGCISHTTGKFCVSCNTSTDELTIQVNDAHCPGSILDADSTFEVAFKPRPEVHIQPAASLRQTGRDFQHKGLCAEEEDQVAIKFKGDFPIQSSAGQELTFRPSTVRAHLPPHPRRAYQPAHPQERTRDRYSSPRP